MLRERRSMPSIVPTPKLIHAPVLPVSHQRRRRGEQIHAKPQRVAEVRGPEEEQHQVWADGTPKVDSVWPKSPVCRGRPFAVATSNMPPTPAMLLTAKRARVMAAASARRCSTSLAKMRGSARLSNTDRMRSRTNSRNRRPIRLGKRADERVVELAVGIEDRAVERLQRIVGIALFAGRQTGTAGERQVECQRDQARPASMPSAHAGGAAWCLGRRCASSFAVSREGIMRRECAERPRLLCNPRG